MFRIIIYHNAHRLKFHRVLTLIREKAIDPSIIFYFKHKFLRVGLFTVLGKLKLEAKDILRVDKKLFIEQNLFIDTMSSIEIVDLIIRFPKVLERPIFTNDFSAIIGRPPENVSRLLEH